MFLILFVAFTWGIVQITPVQNWLVTKATNDFSKRLRTKVNIKHVELSLFNKVLLQGLMIEDRKKDTLLYAGTAKVNLTDWFFLKDKIAFQYIGLDDAIVNMNRTDSVWNYQFLLDYFASPKKSTGKKGVEIDLKEIHLKNVRFNKIDKWIGQDMIAAIKKLDLNMEAVDFAKKQIAVKDLYLEQPIFAQADYAGNRPVVANLTTVLEKIPLVSAFKWNNSGWVFSIKKFQLFDGNFRNDKYTLRQVYNDRFDGEHVFFTGITGSMNNVLFSNDTLTADVSLTAKERSGLLVKKLKSNMKFTPELMEFNNLELLTNRSKFGNYFSMHYNQFNNDFNSFLHNVTLQADLKESFLSSDDLAFFSPDLKTWKRDFFLEGTAKGTVDNFSARRLKIRSGNTYVDGDLAMRGLPDINNCFIDFKSNLLQTNYRDLVAIAPALKNITQVAIPKLGAISYTGYFTGFIKDFVTYGSFKTNLGSITADMNMKIPDGKPPSYSGSISTGGFNIGAFMNSSQLGMVALSSKIAGTGFSLQNLNANVKGNVRRFDFGGYSYQNAVINGDFKKKLFRGHLSIDDPNLKIDKLDGELNLSTKEIAFKLDAAVATANLKNLLLTKDNLSLSGIFSLDFTGSNIDNFLGTARIYDATLRHDTTQLSFQSLTLTSELVDNKKLLTIKSNEVDASIYGQFKILELPDAFNVFLARYYPSYFKLPTYQVSRQDFTFKIKTHNIDEYTSLLDSRLHGFNNAIISGNLGLENYQLKLNATVPEFSYDGKVFTNLMLMGAGNRDTLHTEIAVDDILISDSLHFPGTKLKISANNNLSLIKLNTTGSKILGDAELNASIQSLTDGFKIHFFPSSFVINDKKWQLEKDGEITLRKKYIDASEVKFFHENQQIVFATELDELTDNTNLIAKLTNLDLDFMPVIFKDPAVGGLVTGTATLKNPFGKSVIEFEGVADSFRLDNKLIGKINLAANANTATGIVKYTASTASEENKFSLDGFYNYKDSTGHQLEANLLSEKLNIDILQPYLSTIFSEMGGIATGNIKLYGSAQHKYITGDASIAAGVLKVAYTQCKYLFDKQTIHFTEDEIDLGTIKLRDTLNNSGQMSGKMHHTFFNDFSFENMRFETGKMLLLNTTKKDNIQFYGNVIGSAVMTLAGPVTNLQMNIDGEPSILDSSHIYLPISESKESNAIDYIEFIQFGSLADNQFKRDLSTNIVVNMNLTANPACQVDVILDEETGDIIKGQGNGRLNIRVGNKEPLTIRGRYELTKGEYTFNFQTYLKKPFTLNQGSITWNGDPYEAIINMDAEYLAKNVDLSSLTNSYNQKEDVTIVSHLNGSLKKPVISFDFRLPETSEKSKDYILVKRLADFKNDENEMNKQVASLLLFNTFISNTQNFLSQENTIAFATNTIGGVISGWLTNTFNRELEKATKGVISTYIDISPTVSLQKTATQLQANVRAGLKILLTNRLNILIGGNLDYNNPYYLEANRKGLFTPDITVEWLLNKNGSLRVVGFNRTSVDITTGQRNRSGVQLSYRKDFNTLGDIFKSKKRLQKEDSIKISPQL